MATKRQRWAILWGDGRLTDVDRPKDERPLTPADAAAGAEWVEIDLEQRHPYPTPLGYDRATKRLVKRPRVVAELSDAEVAIVALARPQDKAVAAEVAARAGRILPAGGGP